MGAFEPFADAWKACLALARNQAYVAVVWCLPLLQGTDSTTTPHLGQSTRRMAYTKDTAIPQRGTNSKHRGASVS